MKNLVLVESPAKAKTINRFLGSSYRVMATMGHIRDLPKSKLGVDIENDFKPHFTIIREKQRIVKQIQKAAQESQAIFLAADPDREGEAICWHLAELLKKSNQNIHRVLFHEITKKAVTEAFKEIRTLDEDKIKAQLTRRILDRLVGYLISPLLWDKIGQRLSAGRVQSIALRLICEREKEIQNFVPEEYWTITAILEAAQPPSFSANLVKIEGKKARIPDEAAATRIVHELWKLPFILKKIKVKEKRKTPPPPYITSTLQQDCFRLFHYPVKKTMAIAQRLYEGLEVGDRGRVGLITYMRTDSVRVSPLALAGAKKFIQENFPPEYLPPKARIYKNKRKAQDAHEAIRPTYFDLPPDKVKPYLKPEEYNVYQLIWKRFIASQMSAAQIEETEFEIEAGKYQFQAKGEVVKFDGFLILYRKEKETRRRKSKNENFKEEASQVILPPVREGEMLELLDLKSKQNFTQPPPRYTEGTLVRELEARGIGRPSTYAPIIATLQDRVYVVKEKGKFIPTDLGMYVTDFLIQNFPDLMDFKFTARLEEELDRISEGQREWLDYLRSYYRLLDEDLARARQLESVKGKGIPLEEKCPICGRSLVIKEGKFGRFKACSGFPECTFRESLIKKEVKQLEEKCPECGALLVVRRGRYGQFIACSNYPRCHFIKKDAQDTGLPCPRGCGGTLIKRKSRRGKIFYGCSHFPHCNFATWDEPVGQPCPQCQSNVLLKKKAKGKIILTCANPDCSYQEERSSKEGDKDEADD
jgi:DNA topoisomerase-1